MYNIAVDYKSRKPIFDQLVDNFSELIFGGVISPDEQLPSVRSLAAELAVNPNTIQKAYSELERRGVTYTVPTKGSFAQRDLTALRDFYRNKAHALLRSGINSAVNAGLGDSEIIDFISEYLNEIKEKKDGK